MKIILAEPGYGDCLDCGYSGEVNVQVYSSVTELLANKEIRQQLVQSGWIPLSDIKNMDDKAVLEKKFYTIYPHVSQEVDLNGEMNHLVNYLSSGQMVLVQKVDPESVLSPENWKKVLQGQRRMRDLAKARMKAQKIRSEKAAKNKLARAKRALEKQQEKVKLLEEAEKIGN